MSNDIWIRDSWSCHEKGWHAEESERELCSQNSETNYRMSINSHGRLCLYIDSLFFCLLDETMTVSCDLLPDSNQGIISQLYILESFLIPSSSAVLPCSQSDADQMHSSHWFSVNHKIEVRQKRHLLTDCMIYCQYWY